MHLPVLKPFAVAVAIAALMTACKKDDDKDDNNDDATPPTGVLYLTSNNYNAGQNAVLAYKRATDGTLTALPAGSSFSTSGRGHRNPMQILGPNDIDQATAVSEDNKYLFTVNSGSDQIAVFRLKADGKLEAVAGSPFASGGNNPVSVNVSGDRLYVVNKNQDPEESVPTAPNYTGFNIGSDGKLTAISGSTFEVAASSSPSQAYIAPSAKNLLFGADFLAFHKNVGPLRSLVIGSDGKLSASPGTPQFAPPGDSTGGGVLGLWKHPGSNVLYAGFPMQGKFGVYTFDAGTGALTYLRSIAAGRAVCWFRTTTDGSKLYVLNSLDNTVGVYNTSDAMNPALMQTLHLKNDGPLFTPPPPAPPNQPTSQPFALELSPDGKYLYVVNHRANPDASVTVGNGIHTLVVAADGMLSEPSEPVVPATPFDARPYGLKVY